MTFSLYQRSSPFGRLSVFGSAFVIASCGGGDVGQLNPTDSKPQAVIEIPSGSTLLVGRGYNSVKGEALGPCVKASSERLTTVGGRGAQQTDYTMKHIDSFESLAESLNVSIAGAYGKGMFRGSAKAGLFQSKDVTTHSTYLLVSVKVANQTEVLERYEYEPEAKALLQAGNRAEFLARCGDEFVAARTTGGEFTAIVEFKSKSQEEKREIEAAVRAKGGTWNVAADFKNSMAAISRVSETQVTILRTGTTGALPNIENLVQTALDFPAQVNQNTSWPFTITTVSYDAVLDGASEGLPRPVNLERQRGFLEDVFRVKMTLTKLRNDVLYILKNQNQFQNIDVAQLNATNAELDAKLRDAENAPVACFNDPAQLANCSAHNITVPHVAYPVRFSNANALCAWRREEGLRLGRITRRQFDGMVESNSVPLYNPQGEFGAEMECKDFYESI
jgi:hypothetical protein